MESRTNYQSVYINRKGKVFVDGAGFGDDKEVIFFADGLANGWGSSIERTDIHRVLKERLEFGNQKQIKALKAYQVLAIQKELAEGDYSIFSN